MHHIDRQKWEDLIEGKLSITTIYDEADQNRWAMQKAWYLKSGFGKKVQVSNYLSNQLQEENVGASKIY